MWSGGRGAVGAERLGRGGMIAGQIKTKATA